MTSKPERVSVYIDGFNLYFGLRSKGWARYLWLDLYAFSESLLRSNQILGHVKYFTAKITKPASKQQRQQDYLSALRTIKGVSIYFGRYQEFPVSCSNCGHTYIQANEKRTDVNIATHMLVDAFSDAYDIAILVSADSDLVLPIKEITRLFPDKFVKVAFPPARFSYDLKAAAPISFHLYESKFRKNQLSEGLTLPSGHIVSRPSSWR